MTLALIAGRGDLPALVAAACPKPPVICSYEGTDPTGITPDLTFRLETLGTLLVNLQDRGVTQVCFAGGLDRPDLDPLLIDPQTLPLVPTFMRALQKGDDGALRVLLELFGDAGLNVVGAHEVHPTLLASGGSFGQFTPDGDMQKDADVAAAHIRALSLKDIGQACVVANGHVIAMEDACGTDAMLAGVQSDMGGILYKGAKHGQSHKIDLPTVGPDTLQGAADAGLRGVVVEAEAALILHFSACKDLANQLGLAFWARSQP